MKIAIIGYGKMGRAIEETALKRNHEIGLVIDIDNRDQLTPELLKAHDVAIEFTTPDTAFENVLTCLDAGIPVVCGTTGWQDKLEIIKDRCRDGGPGLTYATNFSLGVNILFYLNQRLAELMNKLDEYNVSIQEVHHIMKKDAPSGTAISLADDIISRLDRKTEWTMDKEPEDNVIGIKAIRADQIFGIHDICYESEHDKLILKHNAKNRMGLAAGALLAAEFIRGKSGFYSMQDILNL